MSELKQTDLSKRLRLTLERGIDSNGMRTLLLKAADEIDRYYTGMLNWKATAEAQGTQPEATKPAQDLGAAILALPCTVPEELMGHQAAVFGYKRGFNSAMSGAAQLAIAFGALASPADALVAGDRVDAERYRAIRNRAPNVLVVTNLIGIREEKLDALVDAAIQAQKDGHG